MGRHTGVGIGNPVFCQPGFSEPTVNLRAPGFLPTGFLLAIKPTPDRHGHLRNLVFRKSPVSAGAKSALAKRKRHATSL